MDDTIKCNEEQEDAEEEEEEEEEEEVSLCNFALNLSDNEECCEENVPCSPSNLHRRSSSSQPSDLFEFYNDDRATTEHAIMSHAEDIFSGGKLVPYNQRRLLDDRIINFFSGEDESSLPSWRYCESLPELKSSRSAARDDRLMMRSSRSLDCEKVRRNLNLVMDSEAPEDIRRSFSKDSVKSEGSRGSKPRWYDLMFGNMKLPPEMDLRNIKNRQVRRNPGNMLPAAEASGAGGRIPINRRNSWGDDLLRLLSCRSNASVTVEAPNFRTSSSRSDLREVPGP